MSKWQDTRTWTASRRSREAGTQGSCHHPCSRTGSTASNNFAHTQASLGHPPALPSAPAIHVVTALCPRAQGRIRGDNGTDWERPRLGCIRRQCLCRNASRHAGEPGSLLCWLPPLPAHPGMRMLRLPHCTCDVTLTTICADAQETAPGSPSTRLAVNRTDVLIEAAISAVAACAQSRGGAAPHIHFALSDNSVCACSGCVRSQWNGLVRGEHYL